MKRRKPDMGLLRSVAERAYSDEQAFMADREVAYVTVAAEKGVDRDRAFELLELQRRRNSRSIGRKAVGAYPTTSAVVSTPDGVGKILHKTGPTCKVKEGKARKRARAVAACAQAAYTVDQCRFYAHITAPYRTGGGASVKVRKANRGRLHKADELARKGEIQAAIAIFRGEL